MKKGNKRTRKQAGKIASVGVVDVLRRKRGRSPFHSLYSFIEDSEVIKGNAL